MKQVALVVGLITLAVACSPKTSDNLSPSVPNVSELPVSEQPITAHLDLVNTANDQVRVEINPGLFAQDTVLFRLPRVVQGTYSVSNFGSFIDSLVAISYSGNKMAILQENENTWVIPNAVVLDKIVYYVNDTYDIERTETPTPFLRRALTLNSLILC